MKIKHMLWEHGNDFRAIMICEHCGEEKDNRSGYHDNHYHTVFIPAMKCPTCGKDREGRTAPKPVPPEDDPLTNMALYS